MGSPDHTLEMLRALGVEAEARRGIEGGERVQVLGGRLEDAAGGTYTYRFLLRARRRGVREGEAVHLLVDGCETVAVVAEIQASGHARLTVQENLGLSVPFAVLVRDDSYLIEALRDRLRNARRRTSSFNWSLAEALLDPKRWIRPVAARSGFSHLNPEQAGAVACMAEEGVVVIWGPPGTGKTRVLAAGAAASWQAERTVYLAAHTNVAVDNLLERFLENLGGAGWDDGQIVRLGDIVSDSLDTRFGERVAFNSIVRRQREPLEAELNRLGVEISGIRVSLLKAGEEGESRSDDVAALRHRLDSLQAEAAEVERDHAAVPAAVLDDARIVATTIHRAYLPGYLQRPADVVIVDEASVVPFPAAFFASGLARRTAVYAGDPLQLGTITQSSAPAVQQWVSSTAFRPPQARSSSPPEPILLRRQYRMPKEVADLLNAISYRRGTLITPHRSGIRSTAVEDVLPGAVTCVDTSALHPGARIPRGTRTRVNEVHARLVIHLLQRVAETASGISAAVITPYWGQARLIRRRRPRELRSWVSVDTVHRFQGGERPLVIVDLPDSPGARLGRFMRGRGVFDDGSRLLTVALSRPQSHLVVVGNLHFLRRSAPRNGSVARLLDYLLCHGAVIDPVTLVPWGGGVHRPRERIG